MTPKDQSASRCPYRSFGSSQGHRLVECFAGSGAQASPTGRSPPASVECWTRKTYCRKRACAATYISRRRAPLPPPPFTTQHRHTDTQTHTRASRAHNRTPSSRASLRAAAHAAFFARPGEVEASLGAKPGCCQSRAERRGHALRIPDPLLLHHLGAGLGAHVGLLQVALRNLTEVREGQEALRAPAPV